MAAPDKVPEWRKAPPSVAGVLPILGLHSSAREVIGDYRRQSVAIGNERALCLKASPLEKQ
jgi:hypothetical protein